MRKKALIKDTLVEIWSTKARFLSILAIIALGTGFYAGIKATCPNMIEAAQRYYETSNLMDVHIKSTMGFSDKDLAELFLLRNARAIQPGYSLDAFAGRADGTSMIVRTYSVDPLKALTDPEYINKPTLIEGRYPNRPDECLIDNSVEAGGAYHIGDTITLRTDDEDGVEPNLKHSTFTITGRVESSQYISFERGSTTIGNGAVSCYVLIPQETYTFEVFTDVYITFKETKNVLFNDPVYENLISSRIDEIEIIARRREDKRYDEIYSDAMKQINDGENELRSAVSQYYSGEKEYEAQIKDAEAQIAAAKSALQQLKTARDQLSTLSPTKNDLDRYLNEHPELKDTINDILGSRGSGGALDDILDSGLFDDLLNGAEPPTSTDDITEEDIEKWLNTTRSYLNAAINQTEKELADAEIQLEAGRKQGRAQLDDAWEQIQEGRKKLDQAREDLDALKKPEWYVFNRNNNPGYAAFIEDAKRVDKITVVFPAFFILVAALVCLTTMTRMVEEQRTQIGTLKALGYSRRAIIAKYLVYSALASLFGSAIGLGIGFWLFPTVIFNAYSIMYVLPNFAAPFKWGFGLLCTAVAVLCTTASSFFACYKEMYDSPAALMRPKSPKAGKKILLEKVVFLWDKLSFLKKVTVRNVVRYKNRIIMTVVGIAGCTALMFAGFGLQYSITSIVDLQYGNIFKYDLLGIYDSAQAQQQPSEIDALLKTDQIKESTIILQQSVNLSKDKNSARHEVYMVVPRDKDGLDNYILLQTRIGKDKIELNNGVVVAEKIAKLLKIDVGDEICVHLSDTQSAYVRVSAITENYTLNYIYMSPEAYAAAFDKAPEYNAFLANMTDTGEENDLASYLHNDDKILALAFSSEGGGKFQDIMSSLNYIVLVIIICAGALAFVVLYNLANINITERKREIATIKVLGFYDKEVGAYINRENTISTLIGMAAGLFLGVPLERFVVLTAEVDAVMFVPDVTWWCYALALLLTFTFTLIVNAAMRRKLRKIDMVESLKSIE